MDFEQRFNAAKLSVVNRSAQKAAVIESLERDMELLCVTGVEDKLQVPAQIGRVRKRQSLNGARRVFEANR